VIEPVSLLIVDDDEIDIRAMRRACADVGIAAPIFEASSAQEAFTILKARPSAKWLIITDYNLPVTNGVEFLQQLRSDPELCHSLVFLHTSSDDKGDISRAYALNPAGYLRKASTTEAARALSMLIKCYLDNNVFP
jgi:CheY-like chemotaxis protein